MFGWKQVPVDVSAVALGVYRLKVSLVSNLEGKLVQPLLVGLVCDATWCLGKSTSSGGPTCRKRDLSGMAIVDFNASSMTQLSDSLCSISS
eukprot:1150807-Pelagomonas_calceolata.AAC.3